MTEKQTKIPSKDDIVESPKDVIVDAVVDSFEVTTWREFLDDETKSSKFDNPDKDIIVVRYTDTENGYNGTDTINLMNPPSDRSKIGKYLNRYGDFAKGQSIKVEYDGEGFSRIRL